MNAAAPAVVELHRALIEEHARLRHGAGQVLVGLPGAAEAAKRNPSCGDRVTIRLAAEPGGALRCEWQGRGCELSQASASMLAAVVDAAALDAAGLGAHLAGLRAALLGPGLETGAAEPAASAAALVAERPQAASRDLVDAPALGDAVALLGVRRVPARVGCVTLAWEAAAEALEVLAAGFETGAAQPAEPAAALVGERPQAASRDRAPGAD